MRLKELLIQRGMSTYQLAKLTGISQNNLARIRENQITQIELVTLEKMYKALDLSDMGELMTYVPD